MDRKRTPVDIETAVLNKSRRRCALCFLLDKDTNEKKGQIAHLNKDPSNFSEDNLAFLCLDHHSQFDSTTSQHKNYTVSEVKAARTKLYEQMEDDGETSDRKIASSWEVRYPGGLADISVVHRNDQRRIRFAVGEDFTVINEMQNPVSLNVTLSIVYGNMKLALDPENVAFPEWEKLLVGFGIRTKQQLLFPLNLPGGTSLNGHILFPIRAEGAGKLFGGDDPLKRQYLFEFEDLLTKTKSTVSATVVHALDKNNHQRSSLTDLALPGPNEEPLTV